MGSKPHWLRLSGRTSTPGVVVSFDTETRLEVRRGQELLTLRCWDARVRWRGHRFGTRDDTSDWAGETAEELAMTLEAAATMTGEAWCFAHNAGFDLTVTSLPMVLASRGWDTEFMNIGEETCVFVMRKDTDKLVITDSWSWLRCGLDTAAKDVGMRKVRLPEEDDSLEAWHHRCAHDVQILDRLLTGLLDWWDDQDLGGFAVTGAACGWRSMKRMIPEKSILVGADQPRTRFERSAIYGGRKEVWQVGRTRNKNIEDWDLTAAHLTTMAHLPLPLSPIRHEHVHRSCSPLAPPDGYGALARVRITTRVPCAPLRAGDDVWWPVGTFETVLSSVELAAVVEVADQVQVIGAQWYQLGDAMQPWAQWCLRLVTGAAANTPKVAQRVAKGWGRAVPGRFALRTSVLIGEREATHLGWALEAGHDLSTGDALETVTYAGRERTYRKDQDGTDVSPVVLAFVEGYVRAAMARTLAARPATQLLQCNTDGWWEIRTTRTASDAPASVPAPYTAALKATSRDVTVIGPNHTDSRGDRRLAGIPATADRNMDGSFAWHDWPGLRWQLQFSRPGEYTRPGREMTLADHYCRRWVLTSGETVPVECDLDQAGRPRLLPWSQTTLRRDGDLLAEHQVPALQALRDEHEAWACVAREQPAGLPGRRSS